MTEAVAQWRSLARSFNAGRGSPAELIAAIAVFLVFAALSLVNRDVSILLCAVYAAALALTCPRLGWGLLLFIVPFQYLFHLEHRHFAIFIALAMLVLALRPALEMTRTRRIATGPYGVILLAFIALVAAHLDFHEITRDAKALAFLITLFFVYTIARECGRDPDGRRLAQLSIFLGAAVMGVTSMLAMYVPLPELIGATEQISSLRLHGVQVNPNSFALFLMPALLLMASSLLMQSGPARNRWKFVVLLLGIAMLAATGSKAVSLASIGALFLISLLLYRTVLVVPRFWIGLGAACLVAALWIAWVAPVVQHQAARKWLAISHGERMDRELKVFLADGRPTLGFPDRLTRWFRIGASTEMKEVKEDATGSASPPTSTSAPAPAAGRRTAPVHTEDGKLVVGTDRGLDLLQTGQRDRTWQAGLAVLRDHWLWGIGYGNWETALDARLQYPFRSPHNGFLEIAGAYGVLGGVLYLAVIGIFARNAWRLLARARDPETRAFACWIAMFGGAVFLIELVEVALTLAVTLFMVWFWSLMGLQEALLDEHPEPGVVARNAARPPS